MRGTAPAPQGPLRGALNTAVYVALLQRVGAALDEEVRWHPNEYEPDGFVERVQPLDLTDGIHAHVGCAACGVRVLANRSEVRCVCGQMVCLY
jgi:hypothetical protein